MPKPDCEFCHGTGTVEDWVDYGSTSISMSSDCDCVNDREEWVEEVTNV